MTKGKVLQILAGILLIIGLYICYEALLGERLNISVLSGIGPLIMGMALLIIARNVDRS